MRTIHISLIEKVKKLLRCSGDEIYNFIGDYLEELDQQNKEIKRKIFKHLRDTCVAHLKILLTKLDTFCLKNPDEDWMPTGDELDSFWRTICAKKGFNLLCAVSILYDVRIMTVSYTILSYCNQRRSIKSTNIRNIINSFVEFAYSIGHRKIEKVNNFKNILRRKLYRMRTNKKRMEALMPTLKYYGAQDLADIIYNNI